MLALPLTSYVASGKLFTSLYLSFPACEVAITAALPNRIVRIT